MKKEFAIKNKFTMKKTFLLILTLFTVIFSFTAIPTQADSGWDFDYDSGSSWDSSWSSSDSWDSSWDSSGDYDTSFSSGSIPITSSSITSILIFIVGMIIFIEIFYTLIKNMKKMNTLTINNNYNDVSLEQVESIDKTIDISKLKTHLFEIYEKIQIAWMNFDYDTIRKNTTDELFNMYKAQLDTLKLKKQKNIMEDITFKEAKIYDIKKDQAVITVKVYLVVSFYDYVIKEATNEVVRGDKKTKMQVKYELTFVKSALNNNQVEKCPNCGAPVDINASATCPYCDSTLVKTASNYVLSKKTCIGQEKDR